MPRRRFHPDVEAIMSYLRTAFPGRFTIDEVIRNCAAHGFSPFQVQIGLEWQLGVPPPQAKKCVMAHPVWEKELEGWRELREECLEWLENSSENQAEGENPG